MSLAVPAYQPGRPAWRPWRGVDRTLAFVFIALIGIGIALALAASPAAADRRGLENDFYFFFRHLAYAGAGGIILAFTAALSPKGARRLAVLNLMGSLIAMALIPFIGTEVNGARRWIDLGPIAVQPSEFLKPAFVVTVAWLISEEDRGAPVSGRLIAFAVFIAAAALLMRQPDFGQTALLTALFGAILLAAGLSWRWISAFALLAAAGAAAGYALLPHVSERIEAFLNPEAQGLQTRRALEAAERGGLMGVGPAAGEVKRQIPEAHTDFIFAVAAEEHGLLASLSIIALFAVLCARGWMKALKMTDSFALLATAGLSLLFGLQALINIGVNMSLLPPKGMTLPFISYGGSSMAALAFAAGLILSLSRRRPGLYVAERG